MAGKPVSREAAREIEEWLRGLAQPGRTAIVATVGLGTASAALLVAQTAVLASVIAAAVVGNADLASLKPKLWMLIALAAARAIVAALGDVVAHEAGARVVTAVRTQLIGHLAAVGPTALAGQRSGAVATALSDGVDALARYFSAYLPQRRLALLVPLIILSAAAWADWVSAVLMAIAAPAIPLFMVVIGRGTEKLNTQQWRRLARLSAQLFDAIDGLTTLRLFGAGRREAERVAAASAEYREATMGVLRVAFLSSLALEFCATLGVAIVAVFVGFRLYAHAISFEPGLFALLLAPEFFRPLRAMGTHYHARMEAIGAADGVRALTQLPIREREGTRRLRAGGVEAVRFEHVSFAYEDDAPVLNQLDLELRRGTCVALVGTSGSGKSTIARLLLGFLAPTSGRVIVEGRDCSGVDLAALGCEDWLERLGWLPQRPTLFLGTLRSNVCMWQAEVDDATVVRALQSAGAGGLLAKLPRGLDTPIGEGGQGLSGGERQRVALARLFLKQAEVVVIDEAATGLDASTAALVDAAVRQLAPSCVMLVIAHRLASVRHADTILVLEDGRIVEQGRHDELMARDGAYSALQRADVLLADDPPGRTTRERLEA